MEEFLRVDNFPDEGATGRAIHRLAQQFSQRSRLTIRRLALLVSCRQQVRRTGGSDEGNEANFRQTSSLSTA